MSTLWYTMIFQSSPSLTRTWSSRVRRRPFASVCRTGGGPAFENPDTQVSVSTTTSGRTNWRDTTSCWSTVPRNCPLKISSCRSRKALYPVKNMPCTLVNVPAVAKCLEYPSVSPRFHVVTSSSRIFRIAVSSGLLWAFTRVVSNDSKTIDAILIPNPFHSAFVLRRKHATPSN